jgi:hypothetical protein
MLKNLQKGELGLPARGAMACLRRLVSHWGF